MTILEKEVFVKFNSKTYKHYQSLGYKFPKHINKQGKLIVSKNAEILVKIEDLSNGSGIRVTKICDNPNCDIVGGRHIKNQNYSSIMISRLNNEYGFDLCNKCATYLSWNTRKNNINYKKTLAYYSKINSKGYLLFEFSVKNKKNPNEISFSTDDVYLWNCPKCNSEYGMSVSKRTSGGCNCPYCSGMRANETNCLWTTHPEIAKLLKYPQRGHDVTAGSTKQEEFVCPDCKHSIKRQIYYVTKKGFIMCPRCGDGVSYPEKIIISILEHFEIEFKTQKTFKWSNNKRYDFYIPSLNMIIETHGGQHYVYTGVSRVRTLEDEQKNDKLKEKLAKENGIKRYIAIDCRKSEIEWIKNKIIESELSTFININTIEWKTIDESASNFSMLKMIINLWDKEKMKISQIASELKINRLTVTRNLKKGTELGWCNYTPKKINTAKT